jgi:hypothetical protein
MSAKSATTLEFFFCSAPEDQYLQRELELHVEALKHLGQISIWSRGHVKGGESYWVEAPKHLEKADVILLLISPDFLASDDCFSQAKRAFQRYEEGKALVIVVLLRLCYWQGVPILKHLPILPVGGSPITSWPNHDEAFFEVIMGITRLLLVRNIEAWKTATTEQAKPREVLYCYARKDQKLRRELDWHLEPLRRAGQITTWYDREIRGGMEWKLEIDTHLNTADVILLLVSKHFLVSDYCYRVEMQQALERQKKEEAHVIPIILSPVDWQATPLGALQALPRDGKPITTWRNRDEAFLDAALGIRAVLETIP